MNLHRYRGLTMLRRGYAASAFAAFLLLALAGRTESDFFHTHEVFSENGPAISAPCNACDVEMTVVMNAPPPPVLPPVTSAPVEESVPPVARPFAPSILHTQGRAPPSI